MRFHVWSAVLLLAAWGVVSPSAHAIEAVRGKTYTLTEKHGPWMIMVASFRNVQGDRRQEGLSAEDAAAELIYELRKKGIPAYIQAQEAVVGRINTIDRLGRDDERVYAAQRDMVCVLAGNYASAEDNTAQKTLAWIKAFTPEFMKQASSGAIYRSDRGPLGGAFLTINPMLKAEDVARRKPDPDVIRLNNSCAFPLIGAKKPFSLQVASFSGRQTTPIAGSRYANNEQQFDRDLTKSESYGLSRAGEEAEQLVRALRAKNIEAYVHHDRYNSIVAVGTFESPTDPAVALLQREFGAKFKPHPETKQDVLTPETLIIPGGAGSAPAIWVFDVSPQVIRVPYFQQR